MKARLGEEGAYPAESFRLVPLAADSPESLLRGLEALVAEQAADEGRAPDPAAPARVREFVRSGGGAFAHLLVGPGDEAAAYQLSNECRTFGGRYAYVNETYVAKARRGLGLGFVLVRAYLEWAKGRGLTHVYSRTSSPEMRRVVEALGARVKGVDWVDFDLGARESGR
ncbi:MAG: GNAT family N-acetyltransferase [Elusimicrobiota bacterium]|nr:GNAT family N-acetyltransferase [Elusimicrobiota bacterium]